MFKSIIAYFNEKINGERDKDFIKNELSRVVCRLILAGLRIVKKEDWGIVLVNIQFSKNTNKWENSVRKPCGMRKIRVFVKLSESGVSLRKIFLKIYNLFILFLT